MNSIVEEQKKIIQNPNTPKAVLLESIFTLMNEGSAESKYILFDLAKNHECELVRHETIFAIGEMGSDDEIRDFLKNCLENDSSFVVQHEVLVVLGILGKEEDLPFLVNYVNHDLLEVRNSAQIGMQRIKQSEDFELGVLVHQEESRERLQTYDSNQNDRIQIIFQLMKEETEENILAIYDSFISDPCPIVRHEAAFALGEMKSNLAFEKLSQGILQQTFPIAIHEALFALGTTGREEALSVIEKFLDHEEYIVSESAVIAKQKIELVKNPYRGI